MKHHKKNSKRQKLSLKYNIQKRVRESKRRIRKEAKRLGINKNTRKKKDPGIPNSWPFKAEMLAELEKKKEQRDNEIAEKRAKAKAQAKKDQKQAQIDKRKEQLERDRERRQQRSEAVKESQLEHLRRSLTEADVLLEVLDARDPLGCRCAALEAWAEEKGKRLIFVLAKADLVPPQLIVRWLQALGKEGPTIAVQAEAGREGVADLLRMLGHPPRTGAAVPSGMAAAKAVAVVGYQGTGKKALVKAMRQEAKGVAKWLLEGIGHLRSAIPVATSTSSSPDAVAALHLAVRGQLPKGDAWQGATATKAATSEGGPLAVVTHLLERAQPAALMRRFRLPAFSNAEELLRAFAKDRDMKSRKGKEPAPEAVARRLLAELPTQPGCCCSPLEAGAVAPVAQALRVLWPLHGEQVQLKSLMETQAAQLQARDPGALTSAVEISSRGFGPTVDIASVLEGTLNDTADGGDADDDAMEDDDDVGDLEEGEEEEFEEGESEDMSDDEE